MGTTTGALGTHHSRPPNNHRISPFASVVSETHHSPPPKYAASPPVSRNSPPYLNN
ncbi:hypothetical protein HanPSC8_Chr15g0661061 [Helianthus annuus]|nr:hypothetical protein HanPSC8_Chr15g0661061 [Helianthus annuus]